MNRIYLISGPCGSGKTTFANEFSKRLADERGQVYLIHGDDYHAGFIEGNGGKMLEWPGILRFNWECILMTAEKALERGLDVIIDYVVEDELNCVAELARRYDARLYYIVLTASEKAIRERLTGRGDAYLIDRALFLKKKLEAMAENRGHLLDNTAGVCADRLDTESFRME